MMIANVGLGLNKEGARIETSGFLVGNAKTFLFGVLDLKSQKIRLCCMYSGAPYEEKL